MLINSHVNFWINNFKRLKNLHVYTLSEKTPIIAIIKIKKKKMKERMNKVWLMDKALIGMEESAGAAIQRCSLNKVFWKIVKKLQENTCSGASF